MTRENTRKTLRLIGIIFSICLLLGFFSYSYLTKCILGAASMSRYDLFCYLCVSSNIRNSPTDGISGQAIYLSRAELTDGAGYYPASSTVSFTSVSLPNEILKKTEKHFESLGFTQNGSSTYEGANFVGYQTKLKGNNSSIQIEMRHSNDTSPNQVTITESFFGEKEQP